MDQDLGTPSPGGPASADNPSGVGPSGGPPQAPETPPPGSESPPAGQQPPPRRYLDRFETPDQLEEYARRIAPQLNASQQEALRLRQEHERERQDAAALRAELQAIRAQVAPQQAQEPSYSLRDAIDELTLRNNPAPLESFQREIAELRQTVRGFNPAQLEAQFAQNLMTAVRPQQMRQFLGQRHPELNDPASPLYAQVWDAYARAEQDPYYQLKFDQNPQMAIEVIGPDGYTPRKVDMRIVDDVATQIKAEQGRKARDDAEAKRKNAPMVESGPGGGRAVNPEPTEPLLYEDELRDPRIVDALRSAGRGADRRSQGTFYWKNMDPKEKARRTALYHAGQWNGKRIA